MPDVDAMSKLQRWLWRAKWVIGSLVVLFLIQWRLAGWSDAWDLLVGRKTPRNVPYPYVAWPLSVIGWLVLPALIAGIVAYLITSQADRRRTLTITDMRAAIEARGGPLGVRMPRMYGRDRVRRYERSLADLDLGPLHEPFVQPFVRVHEGDVVRADRCWRQCVNDFLNAAAAAEDVPRRHVRSWAEETAVEALRYPATTSVPPYCAWCTARRLAPGNPAEAR
ncbi:DUF6313 family protein [Streptomyces sp. NPDC085900]|uniref:DUF6313 family protein n=1 Tax=Streptomyces sp. NPDC085900 TaxID=3365737 RepID=UPI0037D76909